MADEIFTIKKGSRIVIEVAEPQSSKAKPVSRQSTGIIKQRRETEYLARRKKSQNGISFIDLGQIKIEDVFASNGTLLVPDVTVFSDIQIATLNVTNEDREGFVAGIETEVFAAFGDDIPSEILQDRKSGRTVFEKHFRRLRARRGNRFR